MSVPDLLIRVKHVGDVPVPLPRYQTSGAAGMDLHAALKDPVVVPPLGRVRVPTGLVPEDSATPDRWSRTRKSRPGGSGDPDRGRAGPAAAGQA